MVATVNIFEEIAADGSYSGQSGLLTNPNAWGGQQPRITLHTGSGGFVRVLYLTDDTNITLWKLMKRTGTATWVLEASGSSTDDVFLLRDPRDDSAYIISCPSGVISIQSSHDSWVGVTAIPGDWPVFALASTRHYSGAGIGPDGTIGFKASHEVPAGGAETTSQTTTQYITGKYNIGAGTYSWTTFQEKYIGLRNTYDYIFPNPGTGPSGINGSSSIDLYATTAGYPLSLSTYYWLGYTQYFANNQNPGLYWSNSHTIDNPFSSQATSIFNYRTYDAIYDLQGRMFTLYIIQNDMTNTKSDGFYLSVASPSGELIADIYLLNIHVIGQVRIYEDAAGDKYILAGTLGSIAPTFRIYRLIETPPTPGSGANPTFSLSTSYEDLSSALGNYAPQYYMFYLARPQGGNTRNTNTVDLIFNARNTFYDGSAYDSSVAASYAGGGQRVVYVNASLS